jgi:hypothetical protein
VYVINDLICNTVANNWLAKNPIIRSVLAGVFLMLFAFSITPKKSLHDLITNHKDQTYNPCKEGIGEVSKAGFNCKCDNLVAESPFTQQLSVIELPVLLPASAQYVIRYHHYDYSDNFFFELRGPPVC